MSIQNLEPKVVWKNFYALTQIPRPSHHEEKVIEHLYNWGVAHGFETIKEGTGNLHNVIIRVPATPGMENRKGVILQGHMDMVPQKTSDSTHDFLKDPINAYVDGEWVTADRTTLGADNGIGLSLAMAALEDPSVKHGPIEVLATYTEETGMDGANNLAPGVLKGDILLNLDSEEEGELCVGCAGGLDVVATFKYNKNKTPEGSKGLKVTVKGLQGGHSGMDISLYRANANKVMVRALIPLIEKYGAPDMTWGGIGVNGHFAFNEPPEPDEVCTNEEFLERPTRVLDITRETRTINAYMNCGANLEAIPKKCITVGMKEIYSSERIRILMPRDWLAAMLRRVLHGEVTCRVPCSLFQKHKDCMVYASSDAIYGDVIPKIRIYNKK